MSVALSDKYIIRGEGDCQSDWGHDRSSDALPGLEIDLKDNLAPPVAKSYSRGTGNEWDDRLLYIPGSLIYRGQFTHAVVSGENGIDYKPRFHDKVAPCRVFGPIL